MKNLITAFVALVLLLVTTVTAQANAVNLSTQLHNTQPKYIRYGDGRFGGLCYELMQLVERRSGYQISHPQHFTPFARIEENLRNGEIDLHFGLSRSEARDKKYLFAEPLYTVSHILVARQGDESDIRSFNEIKQLGNKGILLTPKATGVYQYLSKQDGLIIDDSGISLAQNLQMLQLQRGRYVYYHDLGLMYALKQAGNRDKYRALEQPFRQYQHWLAFSKQVNPAVVSDIVNVIREAKRSGEWQQILDRYLLTQ